MSKQESITRKWHPNFNIYTKFITNHDFYKGLFYSKTKDGNIQWVVTGKSEKVKKEENGGISNVKYII